MATALSIGSNLVPDLTVDLCDEMYANIFRFLEEEGKTDIGALRCVCKHWRDIIDNPTFGIDADRELPPARLLLRGKHSGLVPLARKGTSVEASRGEDDTAILTVSDRATGAVLHTVSFSPLMLDRLLALAGALQNYPDAFSEESCMELIHSSALVHVLLRRRFMLDYPYSTSKLRSDLEDALNPKDLRTAPPPPDVPAYVWSSVLSTTWDVPLPRLKKRPRRV